jgi:hypothetical protein
MLERYKKRAKWLDVNSGLVVIVYNNWLRWSFNRNCWGRSRPKCVPTKQSKHPDFCGRRIPDRGLDYPVPSYTVAVVRKQKWRQRVLSRHHVLSVRARQSTLSPERHPNGYALLSMGRNKSGQDELWERWHWSHRLSCTDGAAEAKQSAQKKDKEELRSGEDDIER